MSEPVSALETLAPIADNWRAFAIATLTDQHAAILEQSRQVTLNEEETQELRRLADALEAMQAPPEPEPPAGVPLCIVCDAPLGGCEHDARRYLGPILYEREEGAKGWRVPEHERERWENPPHIVSNTPTETVVALSDLYDQVSGVCKIGSPLERRLGLEYDSDPMRVSRIVRQFLEDAGSKRLHSPGGVLYNRLGSSET